MEILTVKGKNRKKIELVFGCRFYATDKFNRRYLYQYLGVMPDGCGYDYYLHNETNGAYSNVEAKWFSQREIEVVKTDHVLTTHDGF